MYFSLFHDNLAFVRRRRGKSTDHHYCSAPARTLHIKTIFMHHAETDVDADADPDPDPDASMMMLQ